MTLPTFFIPHGGGPCFFMDWSPIGPPDSWDRLASWLRALSPSLPGKPRAILLVSAHWEEERFTVQSLERPPLIYDYNGFPKHTYELKYDAPGSPALAAQVRARLEQNGLSAGSDEKRGFDHGVFVPLKLVFPQADLPVVQLSLKRSLSAADHLALGEALEPLRRQGVLILGSGMSFHNLEAFFEGKPNQASDAFDAWLGEAVADPDPRARNLMLAKWASAPSARQAHPREEHLLPLMVAAGAAGASPGTRVFQDRIMGATISAFRFG